MKPFRIIINGYETLCIDRNNESDPCLVIAIPPNAGKDIAHICGTVVNNHLITRIDYEAIDGTRFILAYY